MHSWHGVGGASFPFLVLSCFDITQIPHLRGFPFYPFFWLAFYFEKKNLFFLYDNEMGSDDYGMYVYKTYGIEEGFVGCDVGNGGLVVEGG